MKIVINACFGGFSISNACNKLLRETGCPHIGEDIYFPEYAHGFGNRDCQQLVSAVEKLGGGEASGNLAQLRVVEIPDDVEWEIDEYDGRETIAETHRTWR